MNKKIRLDILSHADQVQAQGVLSVYLEQTSLLKRYGGEDFELSFNKLHGKFDLIHIHSVNPSFYLFGMGRKKHTVCFVHFLPQTVGESLKLGKIPYFFFKHYLISFYKRAKELVVVNPSFKQELIKIGLPAERITYIPNFVSHKAFFPKSAEEKFALRKEFGFPLDKKIVVGAGQVQTRKGIMDFIKTAERCPDLYFVWLGGFSFKGMTEGYKELKREMEKKRPNLRFYGIAPRERMNDLYNACDIFFLPSLDELFPMALLEAVNAGLPYLVRDLSLYSDILVGNYLRAKDVEGFTAIIERLAKDPSFYQAGESLSEEMAKTYSEEANYQLWKAYYERILKKYAME